VLPGLCDGEPIRAGQVVRIETTSGGWGDPLDSDPSGLLSDRRHVAVTALDDDQLDVRLRRAAIVPVARP
jgi:hypothetical protein